MTPFRHTIKRWYLHIQVPRILQFLQLGIYIALAYAGVYVLVQVPAVFVGVLGETQIHILGICLAFGGVLGSIAVLPGQWWLERIGVLSLWTGLALFCIIALALGVSLVGIGVSVALSLSLVQRWLEIRRYQRAPRR